MSVGDFEEIGVADVGDADEINFVVEQLLQIFHQAKESVCKRVGVGVELEKEVDVTIRRIEIIAHGGTEELQLLNPVLPAEDADLGQVLSDKIDHRQIIDGISDVLKCLV